LIRETVVHFGRLDVLVNNAGVGLNKPFLATNPAEWEQQLRVNLTGTFAGAGAGTQRDPGTLAAPRSRQRRSRGQGRGLGG
jgi:NAD(P)-dependent dehydrogenase (short-subunit alcohol dehydrogenase family)